MDHSEHIETMFQHCLTLRKTPGWSEYARWKVQHLVRTCPGLYEEFPARLNAAIFATTDSQTKSPTPKD